MTLSSNNLDSLLNATYGVDSLANLTYMSGSAANGDVASVTAKTAGTTYATFDSLKVTSVTDSNNTIVVTGYYTSGGSGYGYGGTTTAVPWYFTVVGQSGNDLLLAANGSAALTSLPASTVASYIESGDSSLLSSDLFVLATDGASLGSSGSQTLTFTALTLPADTVAQILAATPASAVAVADTAAAVQGSLDALQGLASGGKISGITLTDQGTPALTISATQLTADATALGDISSAYSLTVTGATAASASGIATSAHVGQTDVSDSLSNLLANISSLNGLVSGGHTLSIALTDGGIPNISLTTAQLAADSAVLKDITTDYTVTIDGSAANLTVAGIAGRGNVITFTGTAGQYSVTPSGDGVSFTVTDTSTGRSSVDHLSNITALKFSDFTDFIANAPSNTAITTGNVTELYSAVLARVPDVAGLAYYQAAITNTPGLTLNQLAQNFLSSPEYVNNSAHNYAQSAAGDDQFVTDTYTNLLHRAPETGAVPYYQNVIDQFTNGLTPGTAAYAAAQLAGHAQVLVNFSASPEFLGDVQITAQHPADAQHFLYLV